MDSTEDNEGDGGSLSLLLTGKSVLRYCFDHGAQNPPVDR